MALDDIRDAARAAIHDQFTVAAVVRSPNGSIEITGIGARLHRDLNKPFGDLDREGFSLVIEQYNQVVFDNQQWSPVRGWSVDFDRGRLYTLQECLSDAGDRYEKWTVTGKK